MGISGLHNIRTTTRIVKYIPYGEYYPRNIVVSLPYLEFLEKAPVWETERWREMARASALSQLSDRIKIIGESEKIYSPKP